MSIFEKVKKFHKEIALPIPAVADSVHYDNTHRGAGSTVT
jgi:hypothetical protein